MSKRTMGTLAAALLLAGNISAALAADAAAAKDQTDQQSPAIVEQTNAEPQASPAPASAHEQDAADAQPAASDSQEAK